MTIHSRSVIRDGRLQWEDWDKKRFDIETCVLVPFFAPIEYPNLRSELPIVGVPRRRRNSPRKIIPKIENVRAISLNSNFTAALSSPSSWLEYNEIEHDYTYLLYRFVKYDKQTESWKIINDEVATQDSIRHHMMDWDKSSGNMWKHLGFDPYDSSSWSYAIARYGDFRNMDIGQGVINVSVPRREWNLLEKPKETNPLFELLLDAMSKDE